MEIIVARSRHIVIDLVAKELYVVDPDDRGNPLCRSCQHGSHFHKGQEMPTAFWASLKQFTLWEKVDKQYPLALKTAPKKKRTKK